jgi:hypothetical protein
MRGNFIFFGVILVFLFAVVLMSSRAFLPADMKGPAPGSVVAPQKP